jgi:hypothetical protein
MTHFTESTLEETALEWLGCQRIAYSNSDTRTAHRNKCEQILALVSEVRMRDVKGVG